MLLHGVGSPWWCKSAGSSTFAVIVVVPSLRFFGSPRKIAVGKHWEKKCDGRQSGLAKRFGLHPNENHIWRTEICFTWQRTGFITSLCSASRRTLKHTQLQKSGFVLVKGFLRHFANISSHTTRLLLPHSRRREVALNSACTRIDAAHGRDEFNRMLMP